MFSGGEGKDPIGRVSSELGTVQVVVPAYGMRTKLGVGGEWSRTRAVGILGILG